MACGVIDCSQRRLTGCLFAFRTFAWLELEFFRNDRQRLEPPETVFFLVDVFRHEQFDDMADRGGDDVLVVLEVLPFFRNLAERARKVGGDTGLLGDDERFGHFRSGANAMAL
jgi:hypothetical protein